MEDEVLATIEDDFEKFLHPNIIKMLEEENLSANDIWNFYFKKGMSFEDIKEKYVDMIGDLSFIYGIQKVIDALVKMNSKPNYVYELECDDNFSIIKTVLNSDMKGIQKSYSLALLHCTKV